LITGDACGVSFFLSIWNIGSGSGTDLGSILV